MEVGSLNIKGTLDTSDIIRGQRTINRGFETTKQKTQSSFSSMDLLAGSAAKLGTALGTVSAAAVGGLTVLAGMTPTLAPEFAKIKTETFKLSQIFGEKMKPGLESVTNAYSGFVNFLSQDTKLSDFSSDLIAMVGVGGALTIFGNKLLGIKNLGRIVVPITIAMGIKELVQDPIKGVIQSGLEGLGVSKERSGYRGMFKNSEEIATGMSRLITNILAGGTAGAAGGALFGGIGAVPGAIAGGIGGAGYTIYEIVRDDYFNDVDSSGR